MIKYLREAGYNYKKDYNDMTHKEFYLVSVQYANSENSTLGGIVLDRQENYALFIKDFDTTTFKNTMESVINNANSGGVKASLGNDIEVVNVENGYSVTMSFVIQGG